MLTNDIDVNALRDQPISFNTTLRWYWLSRQAYDFEIWSLMTWKSCEISALR